MLKLILPKNYINLMAGIVNMVFEQCNSVNITVPTAKIAVDVAEVKAEAPAKPVAAKPDDLTAINGIGATFAKRLQAAGITTYQALAEAAPEHIKEVAKLADWQANPEDWIAAAKELA
ncbi:MAG: hypothetical protein CSA11_04100 [Chloroflexi bacterium]|nr:MAG: hypothetical protein CSA11_04100 [Chloroflexota bacterium]